MKIANEVRIGILGVVAITVFVLGYNFLRGKGFFSSSKIIKAVYSKVEGLKPANRISLNGFDIGTITEMYVTDGDIDNGVTVEMSVNKDINIPTDSKAVIVSDGLLGGKAVELELGQASTFVKGGNYIKGDVRAGLLDKVSVELDPMLADLKRTLASLDTAVVGVKNILNPTTQSHLISTMANLNVTTQEFAALATTLGKQKENINVVMNNLNGFSTNLNNKNGTINRTLENLETTSQNFSRIQLEQTVAKLDKTLADFQTTLAKVNNGQGSLGLLINDDKLYKNLKNTSETLNNLLYDLSARPYRYVNLSLFGGKKTESEPLKAPNADK